MAYFFECDNCGDQFRLDNDLDFLYPDQTKTCDACNIRGCENCIMDGLCWVCEKKAAEDEKPLDKWRQNG